MVELQAPLPSSRLGGFDRMSDGGDGLVAVEPRAIGGAAWALDSGGRGGGGVDEATGVERRQSRVGSGHGGLNLPGEESGSAAWLQRSLTERPRGARQGAMERESVVERAHSERLMMVGAPDKTEGRGGGWKSGPAAEAEDLRAGGGFQRKENLPGGMGSRRSMTMNEAKLIQPIGQAVVCMDIQGRITHWNRAAEVMYMWRTTEAVSRNFVELLSPIDLKEEWTGVLERVKASGVSWSGSFRAARKDGVILNILVTNTPIVDDEERIIGVVGISSEDVLHSTPGSLITRSHSSEGFMSEGEKHSPRQTSSAEGQNFWRRAQLEPENQARDEFPDEFPDDLSNAASGNLQKVKESMQQLLRSFQGGGKPPKDLGAERRVQSGKELGVDSMARSASHPFGGAVEASQVRTAAKESGDSHFREKWESAPAKLVLPAKPFTFGEGGSWENLTSQDTGKDALVSSLANSQMGTYNQSLSRSSSGSAPGSAAGRDLSSIGSPVDRSILEGTWNPTAPGLNFQQAEEDFQLQSALALRVAAQAAAVEDPDLSSNLGSGAIPGVDRMEATAYRYWVNCSLSYDDRIEDGFYEVWGMSPYVWGMCTDTSQLGRMPPLENLRAVSPNDATFEVLLVDRSQDTKLAELEDRAIELAYESTDDVMDMASALSILVAKVMGGAAASDERLAEDWLANKKRHTQELGTVVFPIGQLSVGLTRHRALLFKVLADSVGLACRLLRGRAFCDNDDTAVVIVKCGNDKEWVIDLLVEPGTTVPAEKKFSSRPPAIPSPLQFERPFASEKVLVHHWTRDGAKPKEGGGGGESPKVKSSSQDWSRPQGSPRISEGGGSQGRLDFNKGGSSRSRPSGDEGAKGSYDVKESGDKVKQSDSKAESPVAAEGDFIFEDIARPAVVGGANRVLGKSEPSWTEVSKAAIREEQGWPKQSPDSRKSDAPWTQMPGDPSQAPSRDRYDFPKESSPKLPIPWSERVPPKDDRDWPQGVQLETIPKKEPLWTEAARAPSRDEGSGPKLGRDSRKSDAAWREAPRDPLRDDRGWAKDSRKTAGSDESIRSTGTERTVDQLVAVSDFNEFEITWEDVVMGERIGQGSYGMVYRGDWQGSDVAVKVFLDQDLKVEALEEFRSEVALMRRMRHPNIVLFMGAVTKPPNLSIITEFCPRGSLYRLLHRPSRDLDDRKRIRMALDVAKGMNYLHRCQPPVVHRDLKSPNLLVDKNWTVKVCDFGLSRQMHNTFLSCKSGAGTPEWMAPEVLRNEPSDEKSDVYSFGVILWELATLQVPWNGMNPIQVVGAVGFQHRRLAIPDNIDRGIANLIGACWRGETNLRPTFAEIMQELKVLHQRSTQATPRAASTKTEED